MPSSPPPRVLGYSGPMHPRPASPDDAFTAPSAAADGAAASTPAAAAILCEGGRGADGIDALLAAVVAGQQALGRRVRGVLMTYPQPERQDCTGDLVLVDIATQEAYLVSQNRGPHSTACRADSQGFARATGVLRRALDDAPDLVVCNRYGSLESEGEGFADEMLAVMAAGIPLLTAVNPRYLDAWRRFSGNAAVLPADRAAVEAWVGRALAAAA